MINEGELYDKLKTWLNEAGWIEEIYIFQAIKEKKTK